jgi:hypothetical protein
VRQGGEIGSGVQAAGEQVAAERSVVIRSSLTEGSDGGRGKGSFSLLLAVRPKRGLRGKGERTGAIRMFVKFAEGRVWRGLDVTGLLGDTTEDEEACWCVVDGAQQRIVSPPSMPACCGLGVGERGE